MCVCMCVCMYLPNPPHEQDMIHGNFLSRVHQV